MKLISDFRDWFDDSEPTFERLMVSGPTKQEQFELIAQAGYKVIHYGKAIDFSEEDYLDESLHAGEGKVLLVQPDALRSYPDKLCSLYIESNSLSTRYLWIGSRCFELTYENIDKNEWRSNVGEVDVRFERELFNHPHPKCLRSHPLVAIDFVNEFGIDLND